MCENLLPEGKWPMCMVSNSLEIPGDTLVLIQLIKLSNSQDTLPLMKEEYNRNSVRVKAIPHSLITNSPKPGYSAANLSNFTRIFSFLS